MAKQIYEFGPFKVVPVSRAVWRNDVQISLTGREFDTLWALVRRCGNPVDQDVLRKEVWGNTAITGSNLRHQVAALRRKLGKDHNGNEYILTIPNSGYQLAAELVSTDEPEPGAAVRGMDLDRTALAQCDPPFENTPVATTPLARRRHLTPWVLGSTILAVTLMAIVLAKPQVFPPVPASRLPGGRLLARYTSEGSRRVHAPLQYCPVFLAISLNGDRVFAIGNRSRVLSIITTADLKVRDLELPQQGGPMAPAPNGTVYVGSMLGEIMVVSVDHESGEKVREVVAARGPIHSMALSPDGEKLFLAMSSAGVKVFSTRTKKLTSLTDRVCPENLAMDGQGKRLYVAYQCSGPMGRPGHDSVEVFDVGTEASLGVIQGPPIVGSSPAISPDGRLLIIDGGDACINPRYDHEGCPSFPSRVLHLFRVPDRQLVQTLSDQMEFGGSVRFVDNSRFLLAGVSLTVYDAAKYTAIEKMDAGVENYFVGPVFAPDGDRAYIASAKPPGVIPLEMEGAECTPPKSGLAVFYTGDGTFDDSANSWTLSPHGTVGFASGKVGQAFYFDGSGFLSAPSMGHYNDVIGSHDMSLGLYAKLAADDGEQVLVDWNGAPPSGGIRLVRSEDHHFEFRTWPGGASLRSKTAVKANTWYYLAVTRTANEVTLYVDGNAEDHRPSPPQVGSANAALVLGGYTSGRPALRGWLDEIAFYERPLSPKEVRDLYESREHGPCKM